MRKCVMRPAKAIWEFSKQSAWCCVYICVCVCIYMSVFCGCMNYDLTYRKQGEDNWMCAYTVCFMCELINMWPWCLLVSLCLSGSGSRKTGLLMHEIQHTEANTPIMSTHCWLKKQKKKSANAHAYTWEFTCRFTVSCVRIYFKFCSLKLIYCTN